MRHIYHHIPETNHVSRVYSVAAVLCLQFVLHVMLFRKWNMSRSLTLALSALCVQCPIWLFFAVPEFRAFPVTLLRYCLSDFEMLPVAPIITGITFAFTLHKRRISITRSSHFKIFSDYYYYYYIQSLCLCRVFKFAASTLRKILTKILFLNGCNA